MISDGAKGRGQGNLGLAHRSSSDLSIEQVAEIVNVHPNTVRNAIRKGELDHWRPAPRAIRIEPRAVAAWRERMRNRAVQKSRLRVLKGGGQ